MDYLMLKINSFVKKELQLKLIIFSAFHCNHFFELDSLNLGFINFMAIQLLMSNLKSKFD